MSGHDKPNPREVCLYPAGQGTLLPPPFELALAFWDKAEADMDMGQMWCSKAGLTPTNLSSADQLIFAHFAKL